MKELAQLAGAAAVVGFGWTAGAIAATMTIPSAGRGIAAGGRAVRNLIPVGRGRKAKQPTTADALAGATA